MAEQVHQGVSADCPVLALVLAELPLLEVVRDELAVVFESALVVAAHFPVACSGTAHVHPVFVVEGHRFVSVHPQSVVQVALRAQVLDFVDFLEVPHVAPDGFVVGVGMVEVECKSFEVNWQHGIRVEVHNAEAWRLSLVGGARAHDVVHSDRHLLKHVPDYLHLLLMGVRVEARSNHRLEPVQDGMEPSSKLGGALVDVGHVSDQKSSASDLFELA